MHFGGNSSRLSNSHKKSKSRTSLCKSKSNNLTHIYGAKTSTLSEGIKSISKKLSRSIRSKKGKPSDCSSRMSRDEDDERPIHTSRLNTKQDHASKISIKKTMDLTDIHNTSKDYESVAQPSAIVKIKAYRPNSTLRDSSKIPI